MLGVHGCPTTVICHDCHRDTWVVGVCLHLGQPEVLQLPEQVGVYSVWEPENVGLPYFLLQ